MLGPVVNALVIVVCSLIGCFLIRGIPGRIEEQVRKAIGLAIVFVGIRGAFENQNALLLVASVIAGAIIGELVDLDGRMHRLGLWVERRFVRPDRAAPSGTGRERSFSKGFVSASILFCSGSMAIVGSLRSGLQGNHELLFTKSILDGFISLIFGATMGIGAAFSALPVLVYQGGIALAAMAVGRYLSEDMIREMSAVGSLIIAGIGFNFLDLKEIKVANLIPAIFIPLIWLAVAGG
ncbi:MAG: DUF554 domain-containing protein [Treponema sp.]|nr:DUF554 domain-containing protein [Treponema sp.]